MAWKPFSAELYAANDSPCRTLAREWLSSIEDVTHIQDNSDQYGADISFVAQGEQRHLECEIKHNWVGPEFPFSTIQVLWRKRKYFEQGVDLFLANSDLSAFLILYAADILASPVAIVPNKYVAEGEAFYNVPASKAQLVQVLTDA